jgi:hypothetical protein
MLLNVSCMAVAVEAGCAEPFELRTVASACANMIIYIDKHCANQHYFYAYTALCHVVLSQLQRLLHAAIMS